MSIIHLLSHDRWYEMAQYDLSTRTIIDISRPNIEISELPRSGNFGTIGEQRLIVRATGPQGMAVGFEQEPEFDLHKANIEWQRFDDGKTIFRLFQVGYWREVMYEVPRFEGEWDMYGAELEDFDFGLWALNVKNSSERQAILLNRWTEWHNEL